MDTKLKYLNYISCGLAHSITCSYPDTEPENQGLFPGGHLLQLFFLFLFSSCNAELLHTSYIELYKRQKLHSLTIYIELPSKFV